MWPWIFLLSALGLTVSRVDAQTLQCSTVAEGCDAGDAHHSGVEVAIARFENGRLYGGNDKEPIVASSALSGNTLAMITYSCRDGSVPPPLEGSVVRTSLNSILSCPNRCGGVSLPNSDNCGFGVLLANNAPNIPCFSNLINLIPTGRGLEVVPSVDGYENPRCLFDSPAARVLVNGSRSLDGPDGMTVEKCISFAAEEGWRYAGVEFGIECFWGDDKINAEESNQSDCSQPCAGNPKQVCGGGNRILAYENSAWAVLTRPELADQCRRYIELASQLAQLIEEWKTLLSEYQSLLDSQARKRDMAKRQVIDPELLRVFREVAETYARIMNRKAEIEDLAKAVRRLFEIGLRKTRVKQTEIELLVQEAAPVVKTVGEQISRPAAVIAEVGESAVAAVEVAAEVSVAIGAPAVLTGSIVVPATGIFIALGALLESLLDTVITPGDPEPPVTGTLRPTMTATSTSTKSSSICTATATQSPVVIIAKADTTRSQFDDMIKKLPEDKDSLSITDMPNFVYFTTVDLCVAEKLMDDYPFIATWSVDAVVHQEGDNDAPSTRRKRRRAPNSPLKVRATTVQAGNANATTSGGEILEKRTGGLPIRTSIFKEQYNNSPAHLAWLSQLSRYDNLHGNYLNYNGFVFDDSLSRTRPVIYVIDTSFLNTHSSLTGRVIRTLAFDNSGDTLQEQTDHPRPNMRNSHGTCMASLAGGAYHSVVKQADIVTVQLPLLWPGTGSTTETRIKRVILAFRTILNDASLRRGSAVITMSFGVPTNQMVFSGFEHLHPGSPSVFHMVLDWAFQAGVVVVCSAGNRAFENLDQNYPRAAGGTNSPLIVVGNARRDNTRHPESTYLGNTGGILSIYNIGTDVDCAIRTPGPSEDGIPGPPLPLDQDLGLSFGVEPDGTSQATAITAGMMAYYLSDPVLNAQFARNGIGNFAREAKNFLISTALQNKLPLPPGAPDNGGNVPLAAVGDVVPCEGGTVGRPQLGPLTNPTGNGRPFLTRDVTNGRTPVELVVDVPQCWNLP